MKAQPLRSRKFDEKLVYNLYKQRITVEKTIEQIKKLTFSFKAVQPKELLSIHERLSGNLFSENNEKEGFSKTYKDKTILNLS